MPDLLTHALIAYTLATLLAFRYDWLSPAYVSVAMAGAFIPDLVKVYLVVDHSSVAAFLGVPFSWMGIHTLGGATVAVLIGTVLATPENRRRVTGLLALGAASHLAADALLYNVTGHSYPVFWPLTTSRPPTPGLWLSTDVWPSLTFGVIALVTWYVARKRPVDA